MAQRLALVGTAGSLSALAASGDAVINSDEFATLVPTIADPEYVAITLGYDRPVLADAPDGAEPETVWILAHTAGESDAIVLRGMEDSSAREWPDGTLWVCAPTPYDKRYHDWAVFETANNPAVLIDALPTGSDSNAFQVYAENGEERRLRFGVENNITSDTSPHVDINVRSAVLNVGDADDTVSKAGTKLRILQPVENTGNLLEILKKASQTDKILRVNAGGLIVINARGESATALQVNSPASDALGHAPYFQIDDVGGLAWGPGGSGSALDTYLFREALGILSTDRLKLTGTPLSTTDAVTKAYVDAVAGGAGFTFGVKWLGDELVLDDPSAATANTAAIVAALATYKRVLLPNGAIYINGRIPLIDGYWIEGLSREGCQLIQAVGSNLDAVLADEYWWSNTDRSPSQNGGRDWTVLNLTVDGNWLDWIQTTRVNMGAGLAAADTIVTVDSKTELTAGRLFRLDYEIVSVDANQSGLTGQQVRIVRAQHGTTAADHADNTLVTRVNNVSTTRAQTSTVMADGHGIAAGAPHRANIQWVRVLRPYGCGIFFDSQGRDRTTMVGEGIQWHVSNSWIEYAGATAFHNADAAGGSNINDGWIENLLISYANCRNLSNAGSGQYGPVNYGHGIYNNQGPGTTMIGLHIFGNSTQVGTRASHGGHKIKSGVVWLSANAARFSHNKVADFGYSDSASTYYGWNVRLLGERGSSMTGCHAYTDEDNPANTLVGISFTVADAGSDPILAEVAISSCTVASRAHYRGAGDGAGADGTLTGTMDTSTDQMPVNNKAAFPAGKVVYITSHPTGDDGYGLEIVRVTASSGTGAGNVTVTRGFNGTPKQAHSTDDRLFITNLTGFKLRQSGTSELYGTLVGCVAQRCAVPFDGTNDRASARVNQAGNTWQRASTTPVGGYWPAGIRIENSAVTASTSPGWVCTTAGTPGTWTALPNLNVSAAITALYAVRTTDTAEVNTTTMTDDGVLEVTVAANTTYLLEAFIRYTAPAADDYKLGFSAPSGATLVWSPAGLNTAAGATTSAQYASASTALGTGFALGGLDATDVVAQPRGTLTVGSTGGTFKVQLAKNGTSSGTGAKNLAGSNLKLTPIG